LSVLDTSILIGEPPDPNREELPEIANTISGGRLVRAEEIGVPAQRIGAIAKGKRAITADTDLRLCRFFGLAEGYWLRASAAHDIDVAHRALRTELDKIQPWAGGAA
jgi:addiction module HigA family antidote